MAKNKASFLGFQPANAVVQGPTRRRLCAWLNALQLLSWNSYNTVSTSREVPWDSSACAGAWHFGWERAVSSLGRLLATCSSSLSILAPVCPLLLPITQTMLFPSTLVGIEVQGQEDWGHCTWTQRYFGERHGTSGHSHPRWSYIIYWGHLAGPSSQQSQSK